MTVLTLGGAGLIGKPVTELLAERGEEVVCADIDTSVSFDGDVTVVEANVTDRAGLVDLFEAHEPDTVVDLAYIVGGDTMGDFGRALGVNVVGMDNVFSAAVEAGVEQVVWASTIGVYGQTGNYPEGEVVTEESVPPAAYTQYPDVTYYASMKFMNEYQARLYADHHDLSVQAVRPSTVFGARRNSGFPWLSTLVEGALEDGTHVPFAPETELSLVSVDDAARLFVELALADGPRYDAYNTGGHTITVGDLAEVVEAETGGTVTYEAQGPRLGILSRVSNDRASAEFGYELTPFEESLRRYVETVTR